MADATWAELDQKGKLVFAKFGKVFRGALVKGGIEEVELMDLNSHEPPKKAANRVAGGV